MNTDESLGFDASERAFAEKIRLHREQKTMTQEELAHEVSLRGFDFKQQTIYKIESGNRRVTVGEAAAIADALGYTLDGLFGGGGSLASAYLLSNRAGSQARRAAREYVDALMDVAIAADGMTQPLRSADVRWLTHAMPEQTPAQTTIDVLMDFNARLSRDGITKPGKFLSLLRDAIQRDTDALSALRRDSEEVIQAVRGDDG